MADEVLMRFKGLSNITETDLLERVLRFMASAIGSEISINHMVNKLKSDGTVTSNRTIEKYVDAFLGGLILYKAPRYDIKGKNYYNGWKNIMSSILVLEIFYCQM